MSINKTKILFVIIMFSVSVTAQNIVVETGASLLVELGADICTDSIAGAGSIIINGTVCGNLTDVDNSNSLEIPIEFSLEQNYPSPFNPSTIIQFSLPVQSQLKINLYNMLGELVRTIAEGTYEKGYHKVVVNAANLPSGTYVYRLESNAFVQVKKMILLK